MTFRSLLSRFVNDRLSRGRNGRRSAASRRANRARPVEALEERVLLSAPDQWLQRGISGGGVMLEPALSPHNPNELFVGTDMSQMFHSKDAGQSWDFYNFSEFVISNKISGVQFTSDPQVLFALDQGNPAFPAPIRSTDAGTTWQRPGSAGFTSNWKSSEQAWRLYADPNSPGRLVVATQDELYLSTNAGATCTSAYTYTGTISTSLKLGLHLAGVFFDGSNIYAATNAGLLMSANGGSFQTATLGGSAIGGIPAGEAFLEFAGASNGTTTRFWAITHDPATIHTPPDHTAANAGGANVFSGFMNIYTLDVGQANWTAKANGLPATTDLNLIAMASNDIDTVYVGGQDTANNFLSVYIGKHTTANPSWTSIYATQGASNNIVTGFVGPSGHIAFSPAIEGLTVDPKNSGRLMMTDGWEAHTSTDGGGLWQQINVPLSQDHAPGAAIPTTDAYNNVGINNTTVWWVHWQSATNIFAAYDDVKWQRSTDGGATWSFDVNGLNQKMENFSIEVSRQTGRMYLAQGRSWGPHDILGLPDSSVTQGGGDIAYSDDGGATWNLFYDFGNPVSWTALDPNDSQTMYASVVDPDPTIGGVYVSHNIGAGAAVTFTRLAAQPSSVNAGKPHTIEVLNDGTLVLVLTARKHDHDNNSATPEQHSAGSGVFRLDPGATQWLDVTGANMHYWCKDLVVDPADTTQQTWYVAVNAATNPNAAVSGQPTNQPGLYMTTDRGGSWTRVFTQSADSFAVDPNNPTEAYVTATNDGLWYTSNLRLADGMTINPNPTFSKVDSFPHQRPNRVFFNPYVPGEVWISSNGAGMVVGNAATPLREFHFSASNFSVNENGGSATITVDRTGDVANSMSVDYVVNAGSATAADFTSSQLATGITGTLTFLPGQSSVTITLPITNDSQVEGNETVLLSLSGPIGGNVLGAIANATLTIVDDDAVPTIAIDDVSLTEGTANAVFTVTLSAASGQAVTINYATSDGSATSADYTGASGSLTFAPGETVKTISVSVLDDSLDEPDETFVVNLSGATNATIADAQGLGTILDTDATPTLSIDDVSLTEANTNAVFTVTLSAASGRTVSVDFATANGSASSADFTSQSGSLTFAPGETVKTVSVSVLGDLLDEPDETLVVNLSNPSNATLADAQGLGTILDNDATPTLSIDDVSITEGNAGQTTATFTVMLSTASGQTVTVDYATADGTATAGADYASQSGSLTFAPGETTKITAVAVLGDLLDEPDEYLFVNLSNAANGTISDFQGIVTVMDDDLPVSISISDATLTEYDSGSSIASFSVVLSAAGDQIVTVDVAMFADTATASADFESLPPTTLTFAPGQISQTVLITVWGDTLVETDEQFFVRLTNPTNAVLGDADATGTITNDDSAVLAFTAAAVSATESAGSLTFTVTLTDAQGNAVVVDVPVMVQVATANGTATTADNDYSATSQTLTFNSGDASKTFTVNVTGDNKVELDETLQALLSLVNASGRDVTVSGTAGTKTGMITNDDNSKFTVGDASLAEDSGLLTFAITLDNAVDVPTSVQVSTVDGTAKVNDGDYTALNNLLISFDAGEVSQVFQVVPTADSASEPDESFTFSLSSISSSGRNVIVNSTQGVGTIINDDTAALALDGLGRLVFAEPTSRADQLTVTLDATTNEVVFSDPANPLSTVNGLGTVAADGHSVRIPLTAIPTKTLLVSLKDMHDRFDMSSITAGVLNANINGGLGNDTITSSNGNDTLDGGDGNDSLNGVNGDDVLTGGIGADVLLGGAGHDSLVGGDNNDTLRGHTGNDTLTGGLGNDSLDAGGAADDLLIEIGNGTITLNNSTLTGTAVGSVGSDRAIGFERALLIGSDGNDKLDSTSFSYKVTLLGGAGNDTLFGGKSADSLDGGDGGDSLMGRAGNDLLVGGHEDAGDSISGDGVDFLNGEAGNDTLVGGKEKDTELGGAGNDSLTGGTGADTLNGQTGDDTIDGGAGNDTLKGDTGNDSLLGASGNDTLIGDAGNDTLAGGDDNDGLVGGDGNDSLLGDAGSDIAIGGKGNDKIYGGADNDTLAGQLGSDTVQGDTGTDRVAGGTGTGANPGDVVTDLLAEIDELFTVSFNGMTFTIA